MSESRDWAAIPCDLLRQIVSKTQLLIGDYIRAAAVCKSWQACLKSPPKFPVCLMLAENEEEENNMRCFCTASEDKVMERDLPELRGRRCWGTPFGWLVTFGLDLEIQLFNPLSRACLSLPPQPTFNTFNVGDDFADPTAEGFRRFFLYKFAFSSSPPSPDCMVMAFLSPMRLLGFAKPGDQAWTTIDVAAARLLEDVIYFNGSFFAVHNHGHLLKCQDLDGPSPKAIEFAAPSLMVMMNIMVNQDILLIWTDLFLDMHTRDWEKICSLGDRCLFLGNCCTFSVLASDYPGCVANCIYFTDDHVLYNYGGRSKGFDTGIYDGANKKFYNFSCDRRLAGTNNFVRVYMRVIAGWTDENFKLTSAIAFVTNPFILFSSSLRLTLPQMNLQTFADADVDKDDRINKEEWKAFVLRYAGLLRNMTLPYLKGICTVFPSFVFNTEVEDS
ncbi:hypothetical protein CCACVL1_24352 [Corchorus capsularis]|uniref:EF-hand domain-containing protein n=1 Tax=Corchorus capsularis TaxID=210143 RepID=A0A1R3GQ95_COCAP|nr:hypothetical protein CCACVL1_24352 [Corchorus capsularis]